MKGIIYLEDGPVYKGTGFGASGTRVGELVFNTAMTGYQKTLTDPSYKEQIIALASGGKTYKLKYGHRDRGQSPGEPVLGPCLQGGGVPHCQNRGQDRHRIHTG